MQKSGKFRGCLFALLALSAMLCAAGCAEGTQHTHTYSDAWAFDAEAHWHPTTCSHDAKANKSAHDFTETVIPPSATAAGYTLHICACGYSYTSDPVGALPAETEYRFDEEGHWKAVLTEDGEPDIQPHVYGQTETVAPTCASYGYTKHFCECGYWYASDRVAPLAHTFGEGLEHDEAAHWRSCLVCGVREGASAHEWEASVTPATCDKGGYTDLICKECGYSVRGRETAAGHTFSETFDGNEYEHWRPAVCEHEEEETDREDHTLVGRSNVCVVCGRSVTPRLAFEKSANGQYYIVTGIGCFPGSELEIPDTYRELPVKEIGARAFANGEVTSVTFGKNLEKIGADAFAHTGITAVEFPASLKEIGARAFAGTGISDVTLVAQTVSVGQGAFRDCTDLTSVTVRGNIGALPAYLFEGCTALGTVTCTASVTQVGAQAFNGCESLTSFDLSRCKTVGFAAFGGCSLFAPTSLSALTAMEEYAFSGCAITGAELSSDLKQIPEQAFAGCEKLKTVSLSADIGASAFEGCVTLDSVTLHGTAIIGDNAFNGCAALSALTLPETIIRVGAGAFEGTQLLSAEDGVRYAAGVAVGAESGAQTVSIKTGTVGIADEAFKNGELTSVTLTDGVRFIGMNAFRSLEELAEIAFPGSVKLIGANAFRESGLVSVTIPATVETVGDSAFYDCKALTTLNVSAKEIGKFAFSYTGDGRDLTHPVKGRPSYARLTTVTIGTCVETIGSNAFQYAPIAQLTLPAGLVSIGKYAFAQTDLTKITIPRSVTKIGEYAFYGCALTEAQFEDTQNWKAGKTALTLGSASANATYLKDTYCDIDWIRG